MGAWPRPGNGTAPRPRVLLLALALCSSLLAQPQPSRAGFFFLGVRSSARVPRQVVGGGDGREEKVPMTVVVPDYSPRPAPLGLSPSPAPAPAPVPGSDSSGSGSGSGDEDGTTPRLPSERRSPGAPSSARHGAAGAQAPGAGGAASADFISSSPAVPLPAGVADSATVVPMPTPGQQLRDNVGMGTLQLEVRALQLALPLLIMLSFGPLW
ncbi:hypothetical protein BS78_06G092200 [Paspalum vaginatum]|nr:hypothetical protein BS78_06G092200 [Paspalum vaginatum]